MKGTEGGIMKGRRGNHEGEGGGYHEGWAVP